MYPYKAEILSSIQAFFLAWLLIITPLVIGSMILYNEPVSEVE